MSPYSSTLAQARLDALQALVQALKDAETPDEKRRCAVAIFNAPDPCELDDTIEWNDEEDTAEEADTENLESDSEASEPESAPAPDAADTIPALAPPRATASPAALSGQAVPGCNTTCTTPTAPSHFTLPAREAGECRLPAAQPLENSPEYSVSPDSPIAHEMGERTSHPSSHRPITSLNDPLILAMQHLNSLLDAAGVPPVSDEEAEAYLESLRPRTPR